MYVWSVFIFEIRYSDLIMHLEDDCCKCGFISIHLCTELIFEKKIDQQRPIPPSAESEHLHCYTRKTDRSELKL